MLQQPIESQRPEWAKADESAKAAVAKWWGAMRPKVTMNMPMGGQQSRVNAQTTPVANQQQQPMASPPVNVGAAPSLGRIDAGNARDIVKEY